MEVASALKNHLQGRPCPPLIFVSDEASSALEARCRDAGLDALISRNESADGIERHFENGSTSQDEALKSNQKLSFASDNHAPVAPKILQAIIDANAGSAAAYGTDSLSSEAQKLFKRAFGSHARAHWF